MANEINRILKIFSDLQHGDCWIGTNYKEVLHGVDPEKAVKKTGGNMNNTWMLSTCSLYCLYPMWFSNKVLDCIKINCRY